MMKVHWEASIDGWDGPKGSPSTATIHMSKLKKN